MAYKVDDNGDIVLDKDHLEVRMDLYKKTFAHYEPLGWYSTGHEISEADIKIHKEVEKKGMGIFFFFWGGGVEGGFF